MPTPGNEDRLGSMRRFCAALPSALEEAEHGVRLGGQPEAVTTNTLVHPLLEALGYDTRKASQCVPQGRSISPSGKAGAGSLQAPSDYCLLPERGGRLVLEVKPFKTPLAALRKDVRQLDHYMRLHGATVGLLTNGWGLLVYSSLERCGEVIAGLVGEYDLAHLPPQGLRELGFLHQRGFTPRIWEGRLYPKPKRLAVQNPVQFAQVPAALMDRIHRYRPGLSDSEIIRRAIRGCEPRLEEIAARRGSYLQRVAAGVGMKRTGFRMNNDAGVERVLCALRERFPMAGPVRGRFGVHTLLGLLVEVWAEDQGLPEPLSP